MKWSRLLAEGAVIVASVLLALGTDAWWTGRQARRAAHYGLATVLDELRGRQTSLAQAHDYHERALNGTLHLQTRLKSVPLNADVSVSDSLASQLIWIIVEEPSTPVVDGFLQSDYTEELRDAGIGPALLTWKATAEDMSSDEARTARHVDEQVLPYVEANFDYTRPIELVFEMYVGPVDPSDVGTMRLRSTPELRGLVARQVSLYQLLTLQSRAARPALDELIDRVELELND